MFRRSQAALCYHLPRKASFLLWPCNKDCTFTAFVPENVPVRRLPCLKLENLESMRTQKEEPGNPVTASPYLHPHLFSIPRRAGGLVICKRLTTSDQQRSQRPVNRAEYLPPFLTPVRSHKTLADNKCKVPTTNVILGSIRLRSPQEHGCCPHTTPLSAVFFFPEFSSYKLRRGIPASVHVAAIREPITFIPYAIVSVPQTSSGLIQTAWKPSAHTINKQHQIFMRTELCPK